MPPPKPKVAVITGANTGIGREIARDFYHRGCAVLILCRNVEKGEEARADIEERAGSGDEGLMSPERGSIFVQKCDLASLDSVRGCAEELNRKWNRIDLLVNNAGGSSRTRMGKKSQKYSLVFVKA